MFLNGDTESSKHGVETELPKCSLPELYATVENFNKESKKSNRLKIHGISPNEAQKILSQNLNAMSFTSRPGLRKPPQPVFKCEVVRKDEERTVSKTELLHRTLLTGSLSEAQRFSKSQQRLAQYGIPPPLHTFPNEILVSKSNFPDTTKRESQSTGAPLRRDILQVNPEILIYEDKIPEYLLAEPEKQFLDLKDLEWKYYKGITTWKRKSSEPFADIQYNSEKRFVESQEMPEFMSPPLVNKSLVVYPQVDYQKHATSS